MEGGRRLLIYSHDSFGLGHLRRCRSIANALVARIPDLSVLILSGLPLIASYPFERRVQFRLVPGIIKMSNGDYRPVAEGATLRDVIAERSRIILETARDFQPDLFLVDKEPLGVRGEVTATLDYLAEQGIPAVLGLRDVMDDPALLARDWARKKALPGVDRYFREIWVYGLERIYQPLGGLPLPDSVRNRLVYTGYLRRQQDGPPDAAASVSLGEPFLLVTPGGGGDGDALVDWVLSAYEADPSLTERAVIVTGPFMSTEARAQFQRRADALHRVELLTFTAGMEAFLRQANGVVAMGGYNTFCEILSFDKPALIVPRTTPRLEQYIRASEAERQGLAAMLVADDVRDPRAMARALRRLPRQPRPSTVQISGLLDGLEVIAARFDALTAAHPVTDAPQPSLTFAQ